MKSAPLTFDPGQLATSVGTAATSLWEQLADSAKRLPQKTALVYLDQKISYAELVRRSRALAGALNTLGVRTGDRVLLDMQNIPQLVIAHYAILLANAVVVPVNPMNKAGELAHYIRNAQSRVAITTGDLAQDMVDANDSLPASDRLRHLIVTQFTDVFDPALVDTASIAPAWTDWLLAPRPLPALDGGLVHSWTSLLAADEVPPDHVVAADDMALLPYTSGTTGLPKGCIHNHSSLIHNALAANLWYGTTSESTLLAAVPMFHITGIVTVMYAGIAAGATLALMPRWNREVAGRMIAKWRVSLWMNIPTMVIDLLASPNIKDNDLSSLTVIAGGGAAMPQAVAQRLLEELNLVYQEGYGLTETAAPSHNNPSTHAKQQCLGIPFIGVDARIMDPVTLKQLPQGEAGEIVIHGPQVFQGYWREPEATAQAFVEIDGKRFFRTGDLGRVDEEGYFFMTDRLKRMINASGFKVWPAEVELMLFKDPSVQEACVISTKPPYRGESVKAVVVLRPSRQGTTSGEIIAWCREHMAAYKVPRQIEFVTSLPKSASGKVLWRVLQEDDRADS